MASDYNAWLQKVKAGDTVILEAGYGCGTQRPVKVDRLTATQIVIGKTRFRKTDGYAVGETGLSRRCLLEPTDDRLDAARLASAHDLLANTPWQQQPPAIVLMFAAILRGESHPLARPSPDASTQKEADHE